MEDADAGGIPRKEDEERNFSQQGNEEEQLYDIIIPPGVPRKIIRDIIDNFDVDMVERKEKLYFANMEGDERALLAFRGKREVIEKVEQFMLKELKEFIEE